MASAAILVSEKQDDIIEWLKIYFQRNGDSTTQIKTSGTRNVEIIIASEDTLYRVYCLQPLSVEHAAYKAAAAKYPSGAAPVDDPEAAAAFAAMPQHKRLKMFILWLFYKVVTSKDFNPNDIAALKAACDNMHRDICDYLRKAKLQYDAKDWKCTFEKLYIFLTLPEDSYWVLKCYEYPCVLTCKGQLACWRVPAELELDLRRAKAQLPKLQGAFLKEQELIDIIARKEGSPVKSMCFCSIARPGIKGLLQQLDGVQEGRFLPQVQRGPTTSFTIHVTTMERRVVASLMAIPTHLDPKGNVLRVANLLQQNPMEAIKFSGGNIFVGRVPSDLKPGTRVAHVGHLVGPGLKLLEEEITRPINRMALYAHAQDYECTKDIVRVKDQGISNDVCCAKPGPSRAIIPLIEKIYSGVLRDVSPGWEAPVISEETCNQEQWILEVNQSIKATAEQLCNLCKTAGSIRSAWGNLDPQQQAELQEEQDKDLEELIDRLKMPLLGGAGILNLSNPPAGFSAWFEGFKAAVGELSPLLLPPTAPGGAQAAAQQEQQQQEGEQEQEQQQQEGEQELQQQQQPQQPQQPGPSSGVALLSTTAQQQQPGPQQLAARHAAVAPPMGLSLAAAGSGSGSSSTMVGGRTGSLVHISTQVTLAGMGPTSPLAALTSAFAATPTAVVAPPAPPAPPVVPAVPGAPDEPGVAADHGRHRDPDEEISPGSLRPAAKQRRPDGATATKKTAAAVAGVGAVGVGDAMSSSAAAAASGGGTGSGAGYAAALATAMSASSSAAGAAGPAAGPSPSAVAASASAPSDVRSAPDHLGKVKEVLDQYLPEGGNPHPDFEGLVTVGGSVWGVLPPLRRDGWLRHSFITHTGDLTEVEESFYHPFHGQGRYDSWGVALVLNEGGQQHTEAEWEAEKRQLKRQLSRDTVRAASFGFDLASPGLIFIIRFKTRTTTAVDATTQQRVTKHRCTVDNMSWTKSFTSTDESQVLKFRRAVFQLSVFMLLLWHEQDKPKNAVLELMAKQHGLYLGERVHVPTPSSMVRGNLAQGLTLARLGPVDQPGQPDPVDKPPT